jgi:hypothetical protein
MEGGKNHMKDAQSDRSGVLLIWWGRLKNPVNQIILDSIFFSEPFYIDHERITYSIFIVGFHLSLLNESSEKLCSCTHVDVDSCQALQGKVNV